MSEALRVLITRPAAQGAALAERLNALDFETNLVPLLEIVPLELKDPVNIAPTIIFISANAVRCALPSLRDLGIDLSTKNIFAMGPATAQAIQQMGLSVELAEAGFRSEDLLQKLQGIQTTDKKVTIICGMGGRGLLQDGLQAMGYQVNRLEVYRRMPAAGVQSALLNIEENKRPDIISLMNQESLKLLHQYIGELDLDSWKSIPVVVPSSRIDKTANDLGFLQVFCQLDPTESSLIDFLTQFSS
jgi:uroporphyrinogen-III synthase